MAITYAKDAKAASAVVEAIERAGRKGHGDSGGLRQCRSSEGAVEKTAKTFGRIDVLVNNAGTAVPKPFEETTLQEMDLMIDINIRGTFVARGAAAHAERRTDRHHLGARHDSWTKKGALKMFTPGLAREVGSRGITVNNIQPGPIDTELNPASGDWAAPQIANTTLGRYGHVEDVTALAAFVAGPEASYITGANLTVDGGTNA